MKTLLHYCHKGKKNRKKQLAFSFLLAVASSAAFSQEVQKDSTKTIQLDEVLLKATRVNDKSPFPFTNVSKDKIESVNLGQDLPVLLDQLPSVVTTSDAGAGVGYTGIRVRGSDATRVNVTINGIPYNDAESQGTYFVDLPDFVSSVEDVQLQRGVGTSTNGSGAFGASLNLQTLKPSKAAYATITNAVGSFGTRKHTFSIGTGIKKGFYAEARLSKIASDGYIDRAFSDLKSFYSEAGFVNTKTAFKAIVFGGKEITYQSWYGTPEAVVNGDVEGIQAFIGRNYSSDAEAQNLLNSGRTYNFYTYANQVDNYEQNHFQAHFSHQFNERFSINVSGNFTPGKGYYEEYKAGKSLGDYFPTSPNAAEEGDVIRRKWAASDFYALVYSLHYKIEKWNMFLGGGYNRYDGNHFGEIIWSSFPTAVPIRSKYYDNDTDKRDFNIYLKGEYDITPKWIVFGDVQFRDVDYKAAGLSSDLKVLNVSNSYSFFNPKAGLTHLLNEKSSVYASVAVANKEPNGDDLTKNPIKPVAEQLIDFELGYKFKSKNNFVAVNFYSMNYNNQLVLTGDLDDIGNPIRQNVDKSYRMGIEVQVGYEFVKQLRWEVNATLSQNKIKQYQDVIYDTQYDPNTFETVSYNPIATVYKNTDISFSPDIIAASTITFTPISNLSFGFISKYVRQQYLDNTQTASKSMDAYFINNFNASYTWKPKWIGAIKWHLLVNNIFDKKYVSNGYTYSYYYRPQGSSDSPITENFYYPQAGINFLTGLTLSF
ncbi:TonB-dependent receptor domain-containing protein [Flavobacterium sp.]|uniref:TonB-dependent receptor n=1 Tax=Flavobacterium sp. TaxID=239 RepID=UPI00286C0D2E|nr:TonB-dependent receptor [Flavobacterium sp.]